MGKSKQRLWAKAKNQKYPLDMSRDGAIEAVYEELSVNPTSIKAKQLISLFGLKAEELAEVGITYEVLRSLDGIIS